MEYTDVFFKFLGDRAIPVRDTLAQFNLFGHDFTIKWYGAIIAFGFLLAVLYGGRIAYTWKMNLDKMIDVLIFGTFGGIIGARLYYCIFKWDYYGAHPQEIIKIWEGGLAIYGGIIGGIIAAFIVCKWRKMNFYNLLDLVGMSLMIGQGIGRWGNFSNQEAFGTNTDMPWGMWSEKTAEYITLNQGEFAANGITVEAGTFFNKAYVHPTFLYESVWCLLGVLVLYVIYRKCRKFSGQMILCYGVWYGLERAVVEGFRTDSLYIEGTTLRASQLLSLLLVAVCAVWLIIMLIKRKKNPKPIEGIDYFTSAKAVSLSVGADKTATVNQDKLTESGDAENPDDLDSGE